MPAWAINAVALFGVLVLISTFALGLLWRLGSWAISTPALLTLDEGLPIGSEAPDIAAHSYDQDMHLSFQGRQSVVVFGARGCEPCNQLLEIAANHPATRDLRLVYVSDADDVDVSPDTLRRWETYRFHDEPSARERWRAPVSPYLHIVDVNGRIAAKGIANQAEHLDRFFGLGPPGATVHANRHAKTRVDISTY